MKDLHVAMLVRSFSPSGGLELYAHKLIEALLQKSIRVTVFCQNNESTVEHPLLTVKTVEPRPRGLNKAQRLEHDFNAANTALADTSQFDIVHSQHYPTDKANVITFHNHAVHRWLAVGLPWEIAVNEIKARLVASYRLRDQYDRILCDKGRCLIFPAAVMQADYYATYPFLKSQNKPYVVAYPGAALNAQAAGNRQARQTNQEQQPFTFLFVGRGFRRKGLDVLHTACAKLVKEGRDFRLLIAGLSAKPLDNVRLSLLSLTDKVKYLGFQKDMSNVYLSADAAVLPSRIEPFGMAPLQAMEFGLVPIVSRVSGVAEVLKHEHDSLILEDQLDATALAKLMTRLMDDQQLLANLAAQAQITAASISWDATCAQTLKAYEQVLSALPVK